MRVSQLLNLVALPLAAAMPAATHHDVHEAGAHPRQRATLVAASQFNFQPFNLTNIGMECTRPAPDDLYSCELRCRYILPIHDSFGADTSTFSRLA